MATRTPRNATSHAGTLESKLTGTAALIIGAARPGTRAARSTAPITAGTADGGVTHPDVAAHLPTVSSPSPRCRRRRNPPKKRTKQCIDATS